MIETSIVAPGVDPTPRVRASVGTPVSRGRRDMRGFYDAAQTTDENSNHWAMAQLKSADAALIPSVRKTLRNRVRYEVANNPYFRGIVQTLCNWTVGTGPKLQVLADEKRTGLTDADADEIEMRHDEWARATGWYRKVWTQAFAWVQDGEVFAREFTNQALRSPVKMDVAPLESDRVADPSLRAGPASQSDGIIFDDFGNPAGYTVLKNHPGDTFLSTIFPTDHDTVPADQLRHLYRQERPGQTRGVSMLVAALPLAALLRRYTLAVVQNAENSAEITGTIETNTNSLDPADIGSDPMEVELTRGLFMTMPDGWTLKSHKPEQPTTTYEMFRNAILNEIARCVEMPFNIAAANSAGYNFASGKLDHVGFLKFIGLLQWQIEQMVIDIDFAHWFDEAKRIPGYLPGVDRNTPTPRHDWVWDGVEMLDPREATAQATRLKEGTTTYAREYGRVGARWEKEQAQAARELGLTLPEYREKLIAQRFGGSGSAAVVESNESANGAAEAGDTNNDGDQPEDNE